MGGDRATFERNRQPSRIGAFEIVEKIGEGGMCKGIPRLAGFPGSPDHRAIEPSEYQKNDELGISVSM